MNTPISGTKAPLQNRTLLLTQFSMLLAIEAVVCFYPPLGSILSFGPIVATLAMVPVIITAILLGTGAGAAMGAFAGLFSLLVWTFMPPPTSAAMAFVFTPFYPPGNVWSLVICFVPRILVGVVAGACFHLFTRLKWKSGVVYGLSGALGSLANTFGVLGGIYVFFGHSFATVLGKSFNVLLRAIGMIVLTNGIPEAVIGALAAYAVCRPIQRHMQHPSN